MGAMYSKCLAAVEGCRGRTQCEERCEDGEHMCSPLHYRLPDTTQQHQTHHGYSYPSSSHLSSHWVRALQPSTPLTHCLTALYLYSSYTASIQQLYRLYSYTAIQQLYSIHPLQHPSAQWPVLMFARVGPFRGNLLGCHVICLNTP